MAERTLRLRQPLNLRLTLGPLQRGRADPTTVVGLDGVWRATRTPDGVATTHVTVSGGAVTMRAWGPGSAWCLEHLPSLVGADDDVSGFVAKDPVVERLQRKLRGLRIGRSHAVVEALVPSILEQKVVGLEAKRSYARLVRALGEPAPGPVPPALTNRSGPVPPALTGRSGPVPPALTGRSGPVPPGLTGRSGPPALTGRSGPPRLMVPPDPARLAATPYHVFHRFGVERRRADTVRRACSYARRLEETVTMAPADAAARMTALRGIGPWTAAEVALVALGDSDAVSVGDYHLPHQVAWALAGEARADDARMLELLEPYRGHRGRVIRLIVAGAPKPPRYGPRMRLRSIASI